jgi:hypothetical protein
MQVEQHLNTIMASGGGIITSSPSTTVSSTLNNTNKGMTTNNNTMNNNNNNATTTKTRAGSSGTIRALPQYLLDPPSGGGKSRAGSGSSFGLGGFVGASPDSVWGFDPAVAFSSVGREFALSLDDFDFITNNTAAVFAQQQLQQQQQQQQHQQHQLQYPQNVIIPSQQPPQPHINNPPSSSSSSSNATISPSHLTQVDTVMNLLADSGGENQNDIPMSLDTSFFLMSVSGTTPSISVGAQQHLMHQQQQQLSNNNSLLPIMVSPIAANNNNIRNPFTMEQQQQQQSKTPIINPTNMSMPIPTPFNISTGMPVHHPFHQEHQQKNQPPPNSNHLPKTQLKRHRSSDSEGTALSTTSTINTTPNISTSSGSMSLDTSSIVTNGTTGNNSNNIITAVPKSNKAKQPRTKTQSSKYRGVSRCAKDGRWQARIRIATGVKYLGRYITEEEAARKYDEAARGMHGGAAVLNFPTLEDLAMGCKPVFKT